ncbi:Zinc finger BED domain-containing protein 5-like 15 [Homarus americanus]|uniref:Zinc finger BED domain-containing protein 5-like 15 n=1 Tax=Homarus americanus TaxID=6706 RepID=A0A8J5ML55_HOMAM|nr:Zinc finger BED domain-containing protein 5-like 15 [Homarus americanus]
MDRNNMEDAGVPLATDGVGSPAEERPVVEGGHGSVGDDAVALGGGEATLRHVDGVRRVVERPLEGLLHGVGIHGTGHLSVLIATHSALYEISNEIAKKKKGHTIRETLIKSFALKMVKRVLGEASERKIQQISLSDDTVKRRISETSYYIMEQLNRLKLKLQGKERNVFHLMDCIRAFLDKLQNWQRKVSAGNVAMLSISQLFLTRLKRIIYLTHHSKNEIIQHLKALESELKRYFPEFEEEEGKLVRNPFFGTLVIAAIPDYVQDEFLDLRNESAARDLYEEKSLTVFWCSMYQSYPKERGKEEKEKEEEEGNKEEEEEEEEEEEDGEFEEK